MDKQILLINREDCWVGSNSGMNCYRDAVPPQKYQEGFINNSVNYKTSLESVPEEIRTSLFILRKS